MIILVDGDSLVWRSINSNWEFSYGYIISKILNLSKDYDAEGLIVVWDDSSQRRRDIYPDYKGKRKVDDELVKKKENLKLETVSGLEICGDSSQRRRDIYPDYKGKRKVDDELVKKKENLKLETVSGLEICGVVQCRVSGEEGDDVIATFAQNIIGDEQILICSSDKDFYSLLSDSVKIYNWKDDYDEFKFRGEYGINPLQWIDLRSMMGDTSDNIKGIHGIGIKKGLKIITDGEYEDHKDKEEVLLARQLLSFFDIEEDRILDGLNFGSIDGFKIKQMCEICRMNYTEFSGMVWKLYENKRMRRWRVDSLKNDMLECSRCDLRKHYESVVTFKGDVDYSDVLIIGDNPGEEDSACGVPFTGREGRILDEWIGNMGLDCSRVVVAHTVWCRPVDKNDKTKKPTPKQLGFCTQQGIDRLIKYMNPSLIIALGEVAAKYMMGSKVKIAKESGKYNITKFGRKLTLWIMPHPYVLLYQNFAEGSIVTQLKEIKDYLGGK